MSTPELNWNLTVWAPWTSRPQNCEKISVCCLSLPVYGILLWWPELTKTGVEYHLTSHPQLCHGAPGLDLPVGARFACSLDANSMCLLHLSSHPPRPALAVALTRKFSTQAKTLDSPGGERQPPTLHRAHRAQRALPVPVCT